MRKLARGIEDTLFPLPTPFASRPSPCVVMYMPNPSRQKLLI